MTVGELLTSFPWRASVEVVVQDRVEWEADIYYEIQNPPPETAKRTVIVAAIEHYEEYSILSIHAG